MKQPRITGFFFICFLIGTAVAVQAQQGLAGRVAALENEVVVLSGEVASLTSAVQSLQTALANQNLCSAKLRFYSPSNPAADPDGCIAPAQVNAPFVATVLATVEADVFVNPNEILDLTTIAGLPTHLRVTTRCDTLGNNGFSFASIALLDSNADVILSLMGCNNKGVSNGESTGTGSGKIVPIPEGAVAVELRTRLLRTTGGKDHNRALVTVDVLGR